MKAWRGLMVAILLGFSTPSFADEVNIPFSVKGECFKEVMGLKGYDLSGTDTSWGEAGFRDGIFKVTSYQPIAMEDLNAIKDCAFNCARDNG